MADNIEYIKEKGNHAFKCKDYSSAITLFAEAIQEIYNIRSSSNDPSSNSSLLSTCLTNRSLCHANLGDWLFIEFRFNF